jgi:hypothetical protein
VTRHRRRRRAERGLRWAVAIRVDDPDAHRPLDLTGRSEVRREVADPHADPDERGLPVDGRDLRAARHEAAVAVEVPLVQERIAVGVERPVQEEADAVADAHVAAEAARGDVDLAIDDRRVV